MIAPRTLLIVAHGSTDDSSVAETIMQRADDLRQDATFDDVRVAFLKNDPRVADILDECAHDVVVVPLFMAAGWFHGRVVPRTLGLPDEPAHDEVHAVGERRLVYRPPIGCADAMLELVRDAAGPPSERHLVLIGHGTPRHAASRGSVFDIVAKLRGSDGWASVEAAFIDDEPLLHDVARRSRDTELVALPYFVADGPHVAIDIPAALVGTSPVTLLPALGLHPRLSDVIADEGRRGLTLLDRS